MTTDGVGGEETGSRRQSAAEEKKEAARRQSRRRGSTTPRGRGQGRREGEVAPGAPRHAFTLAPAPLVLGDGRRRRERDGRQQSGDGGSATMARWAEAMSVWEGRTDLGGQALGWRQRRFRGRCESGDGVDALGGGGRWIERRKLKRERGLVAWSGQGGAASCCSGVSGSASEHKRPRGGDRAPLPGRGKRKGGRWKGGLAPSGLGEGGGRGSALPPGFGRTRVERLGHALQSSRQAAGPSGSAAQARTAAATGWSATISACVGTKGGGGFKRRRRESAPGREEAERARGGIKGDSRKGFEMGI
ncbi:hypothetical protein [Oryza sativa Japonica Group]|uniref:Uncharacterized protein P0041E11.25 n=1 Tax=Oryza sativa subsp. japonica TaxID=39947 RepID=Q5ZEK8_ORYSJ|nr:hypothetical protein [Oryza sativa Japonica Group]